MTMLMALTMILSGLALMGGYTLGIFSARLYDLAVYVIVAGSVAAISSLVGVPAVASAPVVVGFILATWFGYACTNRIRSADPIVWAAPRLVYAVVTADFVAIVFIFVRYFAH